MTTPTPPSNSTKPANPSSPRPSHFWTIPAPLKRLFDKFPLVTYGDSGLPGGGVHERGQSSGDGNGEKGGVRGEKEDALHAFFSWTDDVEGDGRVASFNPGCLRWQAYLTFRGIKFHVVPSNNHASFPSTLPLVASHPDAGPPFVQPVIPAASLEKWARKSEPAGMREDVYMSLVEGPIRRAWLYHMYLTPNFELLTLPSYINSQSKTSLIRAVTSRELRSSAEKALLQYKPVISEHTTYLEAEEAFKSLATYLKEQMDNGRPPTTLLDAAVFSYVYLLLELNEDIWAHKRLVDVVQKFKSLREHTEVIKKSHFKARPPRLWNSLNAKATGG
ncbi:mitochondrial outer membrane protein [Venturia nashicola]|nr:mitochondrial outer membrane protein [Venturia nashicola]